jgi:hypothetical protein
MGGYVAASSISIVFTSSDPLFTLHTFYDRVFVPMCLYLIVRLIEPDEADLRLLVPVALFVQSARWRLAPFHGSPPTCFPPRGGGWPVPGRPVPSVMRTSSRPRSCSAACWSSTPRWRFPGARVFVGHSSARFPWLWSCPSLRSLGRVGLPHASWSLACSSFIPELWGAWR